MTLHQWILLACYLPQTVLYTAFFCVLLRPRFSYAASITVLALFDLGLTTLLVVFPSSNLIRSILNLAGYYLLILLLFRGSRARVLFLVTIFFVCNIFCEVIIAIPTLNRSPEILGGGTKAFHQVFLLLLYDLLDAVALFSVALVAHKASSRLSNRTLMKFLIFPLGLFLMLLSVDTFMTTGIRPSNMVLLILGLVMCLAACFLMAQTMVHYEQSLRIQAELQQMELCETANSLQFEQIQKRDTELSKLRHDYKNQLAALYTLLEEDKKSEASAFLAQLIETHRSAGKVVFCENYIVNAVLTCKAEECSQKEIPFRFQAAIPKDVSVSSLHLCSALSNLLDNAIRASALLPPEQRTIVLTAHILKNFLYIDCTNAFDPGADNSGSGGYGTAILKDIAERYRGSSEHTASGGIYTAKVTLAVD